MNLTYQAESGSGHVTGLQKAGGMVGALTQNIFTALKRNMDDLHYQYRN